MLKLFFSGRELYLGVQPRPLHVKVELNKQLIDKTSDLLEETASLGEKSIQIFLLTILVSFTGP